MGDAETLAEKMLSAQSDAILASWTSAAAELASAAGLSSEELVGCIPEYLAALVGRLGGRNTDEELTRIVDAHASTRLGQGYRLDEIVSEYTLLAHCLTRALRDLPPDDRGVQRALGLLAHTTAVAVATYARHIGGDDSDERRWMRRLDLVMCASVAALDRDELPLGDVAALLQRATGCDAALIALCDGDMLEIAGCSGAVASLAGERLPMSGGHFAARLARAAESGVLLEAFRVDDVRPEVRKTGVRALLGHPLRSRGALLGVVYVGTLTAMPFTPSQHRLLRALARRLGLLIDNARLVAGLRATIDELQRAHELRDRFVAVLAHDLRVPIMAAKLNAELLLRSPRVGPPDTRTVERLIGNLARTDRMIRDLLDVNRVRAGQPLPLTVAECEVGGVVRAVVDELEQAFGKRFVVDVAPDAALAHCLWDADEVHRALWNLGTNAVKYGAADRPVTIGVTRAASEIVMTVHNEGEPLSPDRVAKLFDPIAQAQQRSRTRKSGWGLGLTLVRAAAEAHGGRVSVRSDESGTTFALVLPLHVVAAQEAAPHG